MSVDKDFDPIDFSHQAYINFSKDFDNAKPYSSEACDLWLHIKHFLNEAEAKELCKFREHSLFQAQPGTEYDEDICDPDQEIMLYNDSGELIASFTLCDQRSFKAIACYRSDKTVACYRSKFSFKFYAKNCDNIDLWSMSNVNNALYADRFGYYKPTEWDKNNNRYICLDKINELEKRPNGARDFEAKIYSYPDNLPYVECGFFLNQIEFEAVIERIVSKDFKRPSNFLNDVWPYYSITEKIVNKINDILGLENISHLNKLIIAEYIFYSQVIRRLGNPYFVLKFLSTEEKQYDENAPIFEANFGEQFISLCKEMALFVKSKEYRVSQHWQLQTLMMKRDALKKVIFGEMKAFVEFISDLYTQDEYEVETLFDKDFLDNFIFKFFKKRL